MDYAGFVRKLAFPPGFKAPRRLTYEDLVATAITRSDLEDDVRGINASIALIQQTRGGGWPTEPVTEEENFVDLVWHELEFREGISFTYAVYDAGGTYLGCAYLYPMGRRTELSEELLAFDVDVSWWVTPDAHERGYYAKLHTALRHWLAEEFPFDEPYYSNAAIPLQSIDHFDGRDLNSRVWIPHYLPQWSSREESAATYEVAASELRLTIPAGQGIWCPDDHDPPLRVSGVQSGVFSGEVGSTAGQQPYRDGLAVREFQPAQWGWTPQYGLLEVRARMELSARSMAAVWMVGLEDEPSRSSEICIFEVFGDALSTESGEPTAAVGMGVHPFRDPAITDDFAAPRLGIDVTDFHVYAADWRPGQVDFLVDGRHVRTVHQAPDYPMQMMIAVFDFPAKADAAPAGHVPLLAIDFVR